MQTILSLIDILMAWTNDHQLSVIRRIRGFLCENTFMYLIRMNSLFIDLFSVHWFGVGPTQLSTSINEKKSLSWIQTNVHVYLVEDLSSRLLSHHIILCATDIAFFVWLILPRCLPDLRAYNLHWKRCRVRANRRLFLGVTFTFHIQSECLRRKTMLLLRILFKWWIKWMIHLYMSHVIRNISRKNHTWFCLLGDRLRLYY